MVFKRRKQRTVLQSVREFFWPRAGYRRAATYLWHRLSRMQASPHAIAIGFACGAFVSFTPLIGLHFVLAGLAAWLLRGHILSALLGTAVGNPITFPFIWAWIYESGSFILGREATQKVVETENFTEIISSGMDKIVEVFLPMLVGGIPTGIAAGIVLYFPVKIGVDRYQHARRTRISRVSVPVRPPLSGGDSEVAG